MNRQFDNLLQDYYHRVSIALHEPPTTQLLGSDIVLHLPVIEYYASQCIHCTEFGVRDGHSTVALIAGCRGDVVSYDIERTPVVDLLQNMILPCKSWKFKQADTGSPNLEIDRTDFLFFDTLHTYEHLSKELKYHGRKAERYLGFHDTYTCGDYDLSGADPTAVGIMPAINEFRDHYYSQYKVVYSTKRNNGLLILERMY
jgi:hypothetical protein